MGIVSRIKDTVAGRPVPAPTWYPVASAAGGVPCEVVIRQFQPLHMTDATGLPVYAFELTVLPAGGSPYAVKVANPVPTEALVHMVPGARLPAEVMSDDPQDVVIDWAGAPMPVA